MKYDLICLCRPKGGTYVIDLGIVLCVVGVIAIAIWVLVYVCAVV